MKIIKNTSITFVFKQTNNSTHFCHRFVAKRFLFSITKEAATNQPPAFMETLALSCSFIQNILKKKITVSRTLKSGNNNVSRNKNNRANLRPLFWHSLQAKLKKNMQHFSTSTNGGPSPGKESERKPLQNTANDKEKVHMKNSFLTQKKNSNKTRPTNTLTGAQEQVFVFGKWKKKLLKGLVTFYII